MLGALASVLLGRMAGETVAKKSIARLEILWPGLMKLPGAERGALAEAALKCRLADEPMEAEVVILCLRKGAAAMDEKDPASAVVVRRYLAEIIDNAR